MARQGQGEAKVGESTAASFSSFFCCFLPSTSARADLPLTIDCTLTAELSSTRFCSASCTTDFGGGDFPLAPQIAFFFSEDFLTGVRLASSELVTPELFRLNDDASRNMLRASPFYWAKSGGIFTQPSHITSSIICVVPFLYIYMAHEKGRTTSNLMIYLEKTRHKPLVSGAHVRTPAHTVARAGRGRG